MFDPRDAMTIMLDDVLPEYPSFDPAYRRAPRREAALTQADKELAIRNALRYIPVQHHAQMASSLSACTPMNGSPTARPARSARTGCSTASSRSTWK